MAHTYGEVLEGSFDEVFKFLQGPHTAFVDVGSGFGSIVFAAAQHGCLSIGIGAPPPLRCLKIHHSRHCRLNQHRRHLSPLRTGSLIRPVLSSAIVCTTPVSLSDMATGGLYSSTGLYVSLNRSVLVSARLRQSGLRV